MFPLPQFPFVKVAALGFSWYCSYRFMDMFPDANLVREVQRELDIIIQEGVRSITRLIRASEAQATNPRAALGTGPNAQNHTEARPRGRGGKALSHRGPSGSGKADGTLSSKLVQDGLLTPDLLAQLQREWAKSQDSVEIGKQNRLKGKNKKIK